MFTGPCYQRVGSELKVLERGKQNGIRTHIYLVPKQTLNHLAILTKWLSCVEYLSVWCIWLYDSIVTYEFQSEFTLHGCLNVKERLVQNRCSNSSLSVSSRIQFDNHLNCKHTFNNIQQLSQTGQMVELCYEYYLYGAFDCMLLPSHAHVSECIYTLWFYTLMVLHASSDIAPVSSKEFLDIQANIECRFTLKCVHDMITTYRLYKFTLLGIFQYIWHT